MFSTDPTSSADGEWIAYINDTELWVMRPDGSDKQLLYQGQNVFEAHWSTDSREVLIATWDRPGRREGIWAIPIDDGEPTLVLPVPNDRSFQSLHFAIHERDLYLTYGQFEGDIRVMELKTTQR